MLETLKITKTISNSFKEIFSKKTFSLSVIFIALLYLIIEHIIFNFVPNSFAIKNTIKFILRYFLYFSIIRIYFDKNPIFEREPILLSFKKSISIFILMLITLAFGTIIYETINYIYIPDLLKNFFEIIGVYRYKKFILSIFVFSIAVFSVIIPSFAWISSIIGADASITKAYLKTQNNYFKIAFLFIIYFFLIKIINKITYVGIYEYNYYLYKSIEIIIAAFDFLIRIYIYLNIYKFFYNKEIESI